MSCELEEGARMQEFQAVSKAEKSKEKDSPLELPKEIQLCFSSVQFSCSVVSDSLQHAGPPCPSPAPGVHLNSRPSSR